MCVCVFVCEFVLHKSLPHIPCLVLVYLMNVSLPSLSFGKVSYSHVAAATRTRENIITDGEKLVTF